MTEGTAQPFHGRAKRLAKCLRFAGGSERWKAGYRGHVFTGITSRHQLHRNNNTCLVSPRDQFKPGTISCILHFFADASKFHCFIHQLSDAYCFDPCRGVHVTGLGFWPQCEKELGLGQLIHTSWHAAFPQMGNSGKFINQLQKVKLDPTRHRWHKQTQGSVEVVKQIENKI